MGESIRIECIGGGSPYLKTVMELGRQHAKTLGFLLMAMIPKCARLFVLAACLQTAGAGQTAGFPSPGEGKLVHFDQALPRVANPAPGVDYKFDLAKESFEIFVPNNYSDKEAFGVFAFMDSGDGMTMPGEWAAIMEKEKLICLIPHRIGNDQPFSRRVGLTLIGILKTGERYKTNPRRIYTGGISGGARCSLQLAFLHNDVIAGIFQFAGPISTNQCQRLKRLTLRTMASGRFLPTGSPRPGRKCVSFLSPAPGIFVMGTYWTFTRAVS